MARSVPTPRGKLAKKGSSSSPTPRGSSSSSSSSSFSPPARLEDPDLELTIHFPPQTFFLTLSPLQHVEDLRAKVAAKLSHPTDQMELKTQDGRVLADGKTLEFYDLPQKAKILPHKKVAGEVSVDEAIASLAELKGKCKGVDVCFAFDTTGSMNAVIQEVRKQVRETCQRLMGDIAGIRISIMGVGDYCDQLNYYVVHTLDFSTDPKEIEKFVSGVGGTYGGDSPECYEWALHKANLLTWRDAEPGIAKAFVLIADALPHPPSYSTAHCSWQDELGILADRGVKVYAVQATASEVVAPFYARLAERSGGLHLTFKSFDLITRMFLAVCYREAGRLGEYQSEGRKGARGAEMGEILDSMAKPNEKVVEKSKINCSERWFAETIRQAKGKLPKYFYDPKRDMFFDWSEAKYGKGVDSEMFSLGMEEAIDEQFGVREWRELMTASDKKTTTPKKTKTTTPKKPTTPKKKTPSTPRTPRKKASVPKAKTPPASSSSSKGKRKRVASEEAVGLTSKRAKKDLKAEVEEVSEREERWMRRQEIEGKEPSRTYYWHY